MTVLKYILLVVDIIVALAIIGLILIQKSDDQGMSSTITGAAANNYLDKNKGRTREGKLKKMTIMLAIAFAVLTVVLNFVYPLG